MQSYLDLRRLRYFRAIAELGSMSAAARALNLAQPALSHHVNQLELRLGTPLLLRRHDGVALTDAGSLLLRHAVDIDERVKRAEAELQALTGAKAQKIKLRLAVITSLASDLTPVIVAAMARDMPEVILRITESGTLDSRDLLHRGRADFAIYLTAEPNEVPLAFEELYLASAGAETPASPILFADVLALPLVLPASGNPLRDLLETEAAKLGRSLNVVLEVDGPGPRRNAVLAGLGSTIFGAQYSLGERSAGLVLRPIRAPAMLRPIYLGARGGLDADFVRQVRVVLTAALASFGGMRSSTSLPAPSHFLAE